MKTIKKAIVIGIGSIGTRHARNLAVLRPDTEMVYADPGIEERFKVQVLEMSDSTSPANAWMLGKWYGNWRSALTDHADADCAIIASPTEAHLEQMEALYIAGIPFYVEKPVCTIDQLSDAPNWNGRDMAAVGHQYRFHPVYREAADTIRRRGHARFYARDNLLDRYGPRCLETIACHPIDTALWLLGPAVQVDMETDGLFVCGTIQHEIGSLLGQRGGVSEHNYRIDDGPRVSRVSAKCSVENFSTAYTNWLLNANNEMYLDAMRAWLEWVEGGERDPRTATLAEGLAVVQVMKEVKHVGS